MLRKFFQLILLVTLLTVAFALSVMAQDEPDPNAGRDLLMESLYDHSVVDPVRNVRHTRDPWVTRIQFGGDGLPPPLNLPDKQLQCRANFELLTDQVDRIVWEQDCWGNTKVSLIKPNLSEHWDVVVYYNLTVHNTIETTSETYRLAFIQQFPDDVHTEWGSASTEGMYLFDTDVDAPEWLESEFYVDDRRRLFPFSTSAIWYRDEILSPAPDEVYWPGDAFVESGKVYLPLIRQTTGLRAQSADAPQAVPLEVRSVLEPERVITTTQSIAASYLVTVEEALVDQFFVDVREASDCPVDDSECYVDAYEFAHEKGANFGVSGWDPLGCRGAFDANFVMTCQEGRLRVELYKAGYEPPTNGFIVYAVVTRDGVRYETSHMIAFRPDLVGLDIYVPDPENPNIRLVHSFWIAPTDALVDNGIPLKEPNPLREDPLLVSFAQ